MNFYSVNEISKAVNRSKQAIYSLFNNNTEFSTLAKENSQRFSNAVKYNQVVFDAVKRFYGLEIEVPTAGVVGAGVVEDAEAEIPKDTPARIVELQQQIERLQMANTALQEQLADKDKQLQEKEAERKELFQQNGELLHILRIEQQEKMLLLPAPRKSIGQRIKALFTKETQVSP